MKYTANGSIITYHADNTSRIGEDTVLLQSAQHLTAAPWREKGYTVQPLYTSNEYALFTKATHSLLIACWKKSGLAVDASFALENYHRIATDQEAHLKAVQETKLLSTQHFPLGIKKIIQRISAICETELEAVNPFDGESVFHFRVVRPRSHDNNPIHRDVWLEDYKDCINLYIPVAGSNEKSSLIIVPESHYWPESRVARTLQGAQINGTQFNVPAATAIEGDVAYVRPNPAPNEVLVFSPYLLHGGAVNLNEGITRISIELRLWKKS